MTITINDPIEKQDVIDRFNTRVRDWVTSNTNWVSSTSVWNTTVGVVSSNNGRTAFATAQPDSILPINLSADIGAQPLTIGHVVNVLRTFMVTCANSHKVFLQNTGNLAPASYTGTIRLNGSPAPTTTAVLSDMTNSAVNRDLESGDLITATNLINFIEDCRSIWTTRCLNSPVETFNYSYCHSSCHSNHGSHGSRGRR